jgi:hypothetical protein
MCALRRVGTSSTTSILCVNRQPIVLSCPAAPATLRAGPGSRTGRARKWNIGEADSWAICRCLLDHIYVHIHDEGVGLVKFGLGW